MITFYSTNCPKCKVLSTKLDQAGIQYITNTNIDTMLSKGIKSAPVLELDDGQLLNFNEARLWLQNQ